MLVASNPVGEGRDGWTGADDPHGCTGGGATAAGTPREGPCRCSAHAGDRGRARGAVAGRGGAAGGAGPAREGPGRGSAHAGERGRARGSVAGRGGTAGGYGAAGAARRGGALQRLRAAAGRD